MFNSRSGDEPSGAGLSEAQTPTPEFLYVYCVVDGAVKEKFGKIGVGGRGDEVYGWLYKDVTAIVSATDERGFERDEEHVLAHQRVIQKIFNRFPAMPLPFSTVLENETELENFLANRYDEFREKLDKLREIVQPARVTSGRQLIEEALAQSFASALRIRQLSDEVSKMGAVPTTESERSTSEELASEIRSLREELKTLRSIGKFAAAEPPSEALGSSTVVKELAESVAELRAELERIKKIQSEAGGVWESAEKMMKELMEGMGPPTKPGKGREATYS